MLAAQVVYSDVPAEVTRVSAYQWQEGGPSQPVPVSIVRDGRQVSTTFAVAAPLIVLFQRTDGSYLIDGPIVAGDPVVERRLDDVWRRTVSGTAPPDSSMSPIAWLPASGVPADRWPACRWRNTSAWECVGVPVDEAGVALATEQGGVLAAAVIAADTAHMRASRWGRLLIVSDRGPGLIPRLRAGASRALDPPTQRGRAVRLETAALADVRTTPVGAGAMWVAGDSSPPGAWLEVRSARSGPQFVPLTDLSDGSSSAPAYVALEDARTIVATLVSSRDEPAAGALVTTFRVLDGVRERRAGEPPPRRVLTAETIAGADGTFRVDGLGEADYEIVAWHPQLGHGSVVVHRGERLEAMRLQSSGMARGRVLAAGKPVAGVDVIAMPDPAAFMSAEDPIELKGGDARTGSDGRFSLSLPSGGGGELRIGGGKYAVKRVALPRAPAPLVELGDIDLGVPVNLWIVLDQDPGCQVRATGPIGRPGLQIVTASRTGPGLYAITLPEDGSWEFGLLCGRDERAVVPGVVAVTAGEAAQQVRLIVK